MEKHHLALQVRQSPAGHRNLGHARSRHQATGNNVHIVGVSSPTASHKPLVPHLAAAPKQQGTGDILIVCGSVIPPQDYDFLPNAGTSAIHDPGTNIPNHVPDPHKTRYLTPPVARIRQRRNPRPRPPTVIPTVIPAQPSHFQNFA